MLAFSYDMMENLGEWGTVSPFVDLQIRVDFIAMGRTNLEAVGPNSKQTQSSITMSTASAMTTFSASPDSTAGCVKDGDLHRCIEKSWSSEVSAEQSESNWPGHSLARFEGFVEEGHRLSADNEAAPQRRHLRLLALLAQQCKVIRQSRTKDADTIRNNDLDCE